MNQVSKYIVLVFAFFFLSISSCSNDEISEKFIPKKESEFAKAYLLKIRERDFGYVNSMLSPELAGQVNDELLTEMAEYFREGEPKSVKIVGSQVNVFNGNWQGNFTFEYEFESGWNLANTALRKTDEGFEVIGLNVYQTEKSQSEIHAFSLSSKSILQYVVLFFSAVIPLFILVSLVVCLKTPIQSKKWLWVIFVLFGVGAIQVNWTSGLYAVEVLGVYLFGASATSAGPAAPWVISCSFPLGAIVFWFKRKKFIELANLPDMSSQPNADASAD